MATRKLTEDYGRGYIEIRSNDEKTDFWWVMLTHLGVVQCISRVYSSRDHAVTAVRRIVKYMPEMQIRDRAKELTPLEKKRVKENKELAEKQDQQIKKIKSLLFAGEFGFKTEIGGTNI